MFKAPDSINSLKVTSPWPYPTYAEIKSYKSDKSTEVGELLPIVCPAYGSTKDIDVVDKVKSDLLNDADYIAVEHYWYKAGETLNVMYQNADDDGFVLRFPGKDPRNGSPFFGAVSIDSYNFVDRYGLMAMLMGGGMDLAGSFANEAGILGKSPGVRGIAERYGIDALQVGGILALGLHFEWIDEDSLLEQLVPAMAVGLADKAAGWAVGQLPDKYTNAVALLGGRISAGDIAAAGASGAALLLYLQMMDDIALHVEF
jgi:hypothetical protein